MKIKKAAKSLTQMLDMTVKDPSVDKDSKAKLTIHSTALICSIAAGRYCAIGSYNFLYFSALI